MEKDNGFKHHRGLYKESEFKGKEEFNRAQNSPPKEEKEIGHFDLKERIAMYSNRSFNSKEASFELQKIERKYDKSYDELKDNQVKQDIHYGQGVKSGLPHESYEKVKGQHEEQEKRLIKKTLKDAKEVYLLHCSAKKDFNISKDKE